MKFETISNTGMAATHGAGIQTAQLMSLKDITSVMTGNVGSNDHKTLSATDISKKNNF